MHAPAGITAIQRGQRLFVKRTDGRDRHVDDRLDPGFDHRPQERFGNGAFGRPDDGQPRRAERFQFRQPGLHVFGAVVRLVGEIVKPDAGVEFGKRNVEHFNYLETATLITFPALSTVTRAKAGSSRELARIVFARV